MKKRRIVLLTILLGLLIIQSIEVFATQRSNPLPVYTYQTPIENTVQGVKVRFKNGIAGDQKTGGAETWTSSPSSSTYVSAMFYWMDPVNDTMGSSPKSEGSNGSSAVYADSLTGTNREYYKVISSHIATVGGNTLTNPSLTTIVP